MWYEAPKYKKEIQDINKVLAGRTRKEYKEDNKERLKEHDKIYRQKNK